MVHAPLPDTDGDGLSDEYELSIGTDPYRPDSDADQLNDGQEVLVYHSVPLDPDINDNGYLDGVEVQWGYDPTDPNNGFHLPVALWALVILLVLLGALGAGKASAQ